LHEFSLDGNDYLLTIRDQNGAHQGNEFGVGQYDQIFWIRQFGYFMFFDLRINKIEGNNGRPVAGGRTLVAARRRGGPVKLTK
jgi:hypothetical protein